MAPWNGPNNHYRIISYITMEENLSIFKIRVQLTWHDAQFLCDSRAFSNQYSFHHHFILSHDKKLWNLLEKVFFEKSNGHCDVRINITQG